MMRLDTFNIHSHVMIWIWGEAEKQIQIMRTQFNAAMVEKNLPGHTIIVVQPINQCLHLRIAHTSNSKDQGTLLRTVIPPGLWTRVEVDHKREPLWN